MTQDFGHENLYRSIKNGLAISLKAREFSMRLDWYFHSWRRYCLSLGTCTREQGSNRRFYDSEVWANNVSVESLHQHYSVFCYFKSVISKRIWKLRWGRTIWQKRRLKTKFKRSCSDQSHSKEEIFEAASEEVSEKEEAVQVPCPPKE